MAKTYTYANFATDVKAILANKDIIALLKDVKTEGTADEMKAKAQALYDTNMNKAAYNAKTPKKSQAKGASDKTKALIAELEKVINTNPKTSAEINAELGTEYTPLAIANAVKFMDGVTSSKVVRDAVNEKGLSSQREYTAYAVTAKA